MIRKIRSKNYSQVRQLFQGLMAYQPMCTAVLEGVWPGDVYCDDPSHPQAALLVTYLAGGGAAWCFLVGEPESPVFNRDINQAIFTNNILGESTSMCLFTCDPETWGGQLGVVGDPREPVAMARRHYLGTSLDYDWRSQIREGFSVQRMESGLLTPTGLEVPEDVRNILKKWRSIKIDGWGDYGFVVITEKKVVAWATVDFVAAGSGDLGFKTLPAYRRKGLGTTIAAAAIEHGFNKGLTGIHWTCMEDNYGSIGTAKKLGLGQQRDYGMYVFALDLNDHRAQVAYSHLAGGRLMEACKIYEDLFSQGAVVPLWAYFDAAEARAILGDAGMAITHLKSAVDRGWTSMELIEQTDAFVLLHGMAEWDELIARIRENQSKAT